jgi:hypothetical protein
MPALADVVRRYGPTYLERFGRAMPPEHRKVLSAIAACRTGELGTVVYECSDCARQHRIGRSCGNRHCSTCQQNRATAWLQKQTAQLLPCPYFLLTFTLPAELRPFVRAHQRVGYGALFDASSAAIKLLAADPKYLGTPRPGFFGTLHTWGRSLAYHPHVHYVVPGGAPNADGSAWLPARANFFVPVKALSIIFRAKFRDELRQAGLLEQVNPAVWQKQWVVHSQPAGDGRATLKYLAAYVFRVAISNRRIRSCDDGQVTFSYRKSGSRRSRTCTVHAHEFLRRFLQHVLPAGFQKVRYYGFVSPNARSSTEKLRWLLALRAGQNFVLHARQTPLITSPPPLRCAACSGRLSIIGVVRFAGRACFDTS